MQTKLQVVWIGLLTLLSFPGQANAPVVDGAWVKQNLDIQESKQYQRVHVPGAVNAPSSQLPQFRFSTCYV
jgi:3-mercaptopyruvate sulfurtransferase SseA